jgi:pimeloyl-ACP methyl ester carboxylesterase
MVTAPTAEDFLACMAETPRTVVTASGPIQYAERGDGAPVLAVHGTLGGWDQGLVGAEFLRLNGYRIIAPSRPGYLGTPLSTGRTFREQGDALAALLDALSIDDVIVLGVSGGGPASYELAARHPSRVSKLVQIDSVCIPGPIPNRMSSIAARDATAKLQLWLLRHATRWTLTLLLRGAGTYTKREAAERATALAAIPDRTIQLEAALATSLGSARRRAGMRNDFTVFVPAPLENIACPTLVVHGRYDKLAPPNNAQYADAHIADCDVHWMDGSHVAFAVEAADTAPAVVLDWLRIHR